MSIYHWGFILSFAAFFLVLYYSKGLRKLPVAVIESLCAGVCCVDYAVTLFRGRGLVFTDIGRESTLPMMFRHMAFPTGARFYICIFWLVSSILTGIWGRRLSDLFLKKSFFRKFLIPGSIILAAGIIGIVTEYPNQGQLFRGSVPKTARQREENLQWYERDSVICHALGETADGVTLTNSYNALEYNYARGFRIFETDVIFTSDQVPVLRHDWEIDLGQAEGLGWTENEKQIPSLAEFLAVPVYGKYTSMSLLELFKFMDRHTDMYLVFDTKISGGISVEKQYETIVRLAAENGLEHVLKRTVIQLYYYDMYELTDAVYPFENYLLTMYVIGERPFEELGSFLNSHEIPVLTVPQYFALDEAAEEMEKYGVKVFTHTIDEPAAARKVFQQGVYGIYTDSIPPYEAEQWFAE